MLKFELNTIVLTFRVIKVLSAMYAVFRSTKNALTQACMVFISFTVVYAQITKIFFYSSVKFGHSSTRHKYHRTRLVSCRTLEVREGIIEGKERLESTKGWIYFRK